MMYSIIPGAGWSSRMGQSKLLLPLGPTTVLERLLTALPGAPAGHAVVVLRQEQETEAALVRAAGAAVVTLPGPTPGMRESVQAGLDWVEAHAAPTPDDTWLLVPADHPLIEPGTLQHLLEAHRARPDLGICVPTYHGRRGHPVLFSWQQVPALRRWPEGQGINTYVRSRAGETFEVPVETDSILYDLDTPEDYARLMARFSS